MEKGDGKIMEHIPTYLEKYTKDFKEKKFVQLSLCSSTGNEKFEVWYYGDLFEGQTYIVDSDIAPEVIVAKDTVTGEEIVIHDGAIHGYDNMFCNEYEKEVVENRVLKQYPISASKLVIEIGYGIDYEDEKEDYEVDDDGYVTLLDGRKMLWEDVKRNGMDYLAIFYENEKGNLIQFYDKELA